MLISDEFMDSTGDGTNEGMSYTTSFEHKNSPQRC